MKLKQEDLLWSTFRSAAMGGSKLSAAESTVRVTHIPTGITVEVNTSRSQYMNRQEALVKLEKKVFENK